MKELNFETGLVTYKVNGNAEISFNPGDIDFVNRLFDTMDALSKKQTDFTEKDAKEMGPELFAMAKQMDQEMRSAIDDVFGDAVCEKVFGRMNVYTLADGVPLWCNFLMAIVDEIDENVKNSHGEASEKVDKYLAKYAKYNKS